MSETNGEKLELRYVPLEQAVLWERNAKKHDFGAIIKSIRRHGFLDPMKFDAQLNDGRGGIVEGNGRATALRDMCAQSEKLPRGIVQNGKGWLVPILFGVDADSQAAAEAYAVDHNNITMLGGDYDMLEIAKMWEPDGYAKLLQDLRDAELPPVSMDDVDISALLRAMDNDAGGNSELSEEKAHNTLQERFIVPPFSILDARQGYWQERKRAWISLGIQSELGRGENMLDMSATMAGITDQGERER